MSGWLHNKMVYPPEDGHQVTPTGPDVEELPLRQTANYVVEKMAMQRASLEMLRSFKKNLRVVCELCTPRRLPL